MMTYNKKLSVLAIVTIFSFNFGSFNLTHANTTSSNTLLSVPFSTQAPLGEWNDPRQADGCEETSIIMAWMWAQDITLTPDQIRNNIVGMSDYEQFFYGYYRDSSAEDTANLMMKYFNYTNVAVKHNAGIADIKAALNANQLIIAPINPRVISLSLYNRYTTNHTVVVVGYDEQNIIIHDPLHAWRSNVRIPQAIFEKALADYTSGQYHINSGVRGKSIITVGKAK